MQVKIHGILIELSAQPAWKVMKTGNIHFWQKKWLNWLWPALTGADPLKTRSRSEPLKTPSQAGAEPSWAVATLARPFKGSALNVQPSSDASTLFFFLIGVAPLHVIPKAGWGQPPSMPYVHPWVKGICVCNLIWWSPRTLFPWPTSVFFRKKKIIAHQIINHPRKYGLRRRWCLDYRWSDVLYGRLLIEGAMSCTAYKGVVTAHITTTNSLVKQNVLSVLTHWHQRFSG